MAASGASKQWLQDLQALISKYVELAVEQPANRARYIDAVAMPIWITAFTHETYSPTDNNEDLEYLGDTVLKSVFPKYLMRRFPELHKRDYTELNTYYTSNIFHAQLTRSMGMGELVRFKGLDRTILNIEGDMFEAFFGALDTITDMIKPGLGITICYRLIEYLFNDIEIDLDRTSGSAKTQVHQIPKRFGIGEPEEIITQNNNSVTFQLNLRPEHIVFFARHNIHIHNKVLAIKTDNTKKGAEVAAYAEALATLHSYGISSKWAEQKKNAKDFDDLAVKPYVSAARARLREEGFEDMYFFIPKKTNTPAGSIVLLVGIRANGKEQTISYMYAQRQAEYYNPRIDVLRMYAERVDPDTLQNKPSTNVVNVPYVQSASLSRNLPSSTSLPSLPKMNVATTQYVPKQIAPIVQPAKVSVSRDDMQGNFPMRPPVVVPSPAVSPPIVTQPPPIRSQPIVPPPAVSPPIVTLAPPTIRSQPIVTLAPPTIRSPPIVTQPPTIRSQPIVTLAPPTIRSQPPPIVQQPPPKLSLRIIPTVKPPQIAIPPASLPVQIAVPPVALPPKIAEPPITMPPSYPLQPIISSIQGLSLVSPRRKTVVASLVLPPI